MQIPHKTATYIAAISALAALISLITPLDHTLAKTLYTPTSNLAFFIQEYSNLPPLLLTVAALIFLMLPKLMQKSPRTKQLAAVWLLVALFGVGLTNQLILKHTFERPRPRENLLTALPKPETTAHHHVTTRSTPTLQGKSMPSGHAGLAFLLLIPAFIFTTNRRTTLILATTALTYGALVGWARMTLGAHFLSDILIALAINLAGVALAMRYIKLTTSIRPYWSLGLTALTLAIIIYTQKLHVTLTWSGPLTTTPTFTFPCDIKEITSPINPQTNAQASTPKNTHISFQISGHGLPETGLILRKKETTFSLLKLGIHYNLTCTGTVTSPNPLFFPKLNSFNP